MEKIYNDRVTYKKLLLETQQRYEDTGDKLSLIHI